MKTIGLIGGMSWESSIEYYRIINELVKARLGDLHSADCLMYSVDFAEIEALQHQGDWERLTREMISAAQRLERGGAACLVICTNTMHKMADAIQSAIQIPQTKGLTTVGLLGTRFTMEGDFYSSRLAEKFGLQVLIPEEADRETVHRVIYDELVKGEIREESRQRFLAVIERLQDRGAQGIILGCTEIPLLVKPSDVSVPIFDTTQLHAEAAVAWALG